MPTDDMLVIHWTTGICNRMNLSKHKFIAWFRIKSRLSTKDGLFQYNICSDKLCCLFANPTETHNHLVFVCVFSKQLVTPLLEWLGLIFSNRTLAK